MLTALSPSHTGFDSGRPQVCGLSEEQHAQVQTLVSKHLRGIARCPAHITHESDLALLARIHIPSPRDALRKTFESAFGRQEPDDPHILPYDHEWNLHLASRLAPAVAPASSLVPSKPSPQPVAASPSSHPTTLRTEPLNITTEHDPLTPLEHTPCHQLELDPDDAPSSGTAAQTSTVTDAVPTSFNCPICHKSCVDRKILKLHMARVHKTQVPRHPFDPPRHSVDGVPTCALCRHAFTRWEVLAKHISSWSCPAMPLPPTHTSASKETTLAPITTTAEAPPTVTTATPPTQTITAARLSMSQDPATPGPASQIDAEPKKDEHAVSPKDLTGAASQPPTLFETLTSTLREGGLSTLLRHPVKTQLLHTCGLCGQWMATPTALKNHFRDLHLQLFLRHAARTSQQGPRIGIAFNPCLYCERSHRHPAQHLAHCVSLAVLPF